MTMRGRIEFEGIVQGVGFRPALHRFAADLGLNGWVMNTSAGVLLELEGSRASIEEFVRLVRAEGPPLSRVLTCRVRWLNAVGYSGFNIRSSQRLESELTLLCPDVATCADCRRELFDPANRRHAYPFINCTNCGPRYTIVRALPYDRPLTTMAQFELCDACRREYEDVDDRRYHAQPVACAGCGPRLWFETADGEQPGPAIDRAAEILLAGGPVAIRGLGGFHIACRADDDTALLRLRQRKQRTFFKPLAVMVPDMATARRLCVVDEAAAQWLESPAAPIILLPLRDGIAGTEISRYAAPRLNNLGLMLPYTPLHHLLLARTGLPLVMTSGNLSDEPIVADNDPARKHLLPLVDGLLLHDRPVHARCDDSVLFTRPDHGHTVYRHSRGFTPFPIATPQAGPAVLALGGDIKTTFAASRDNFIFLSPHLGDGEHLATYAFFRETWEHYRRLFRLQPEAVACDLHPGYHTGRWAAELAHEYDVPLIRAQHHHAHLAALQAELNLPGPDIAIVADGTGYGTDGTLWGGEVLYGDSRHCERVAHLLPIHLPGGDGAVREPWRIAMALIHATMPNQLDAYVQRLLSGRTATELAAEFPDRLPDSCDPAWQPPAPTDVRMVSGMLRSNTALVRSSALGRLFDGVAALLGVTQLTTYEGQAPMELEALALLEPGTYLPGIPDSGTGSVIDWRPLIRWLLNDTHASVAARAHVFHIWVIQSFWQRVMERINNPAGKRVLATGGCLQNSLLSRMFDAQCRECGSEPVLHREIPPGDGGLAPGMLRIAQARLQTSTVDMRSSE